MFFTLGMKKGAEVEILDSATKRNAQSVEVADVKYRADKELVPETRSRLDLHRINHSGRRLSLGTEVDWLRIALRHMEGGSPLHIKRWRSTHIYYMKL